MLSARALAVAIAGALIAMATTASQPAWACEDDKDLDGIRDDKDACPLQPEDYDNDRDEDGCPDHDRDEDGILDPVDKCPTLPEDRDGFEDVDGCPDPDNDQDGLLDEVDRCPTVPEDVDGFKDYDGCPDYDNDDDGIPDSRDKCPNKPETMNGFEDEDGCPDQRKKYALITVTKKRIEISQKIHFKYRKANILTKSFRLLNEVADAIKTSPHIHVRIEGHTDSRGSARYNLKLSDKRAESVKRFLISAGVAEARLDSIGIGEQRPKCSNKYLKCRKANRRVEFHIVDGPSGGTPVSP